jgi:hypothetical protein
MKIMGVWKPRTERVFAIFLGLAVLALAAPQTQAAAPGNDRGAFRHFAQRLLAGIGSAKFSDIPAIGGYGRPRIAVLPFSSDETKVPPSVARDFNSRLLAELTRQGSRSYRFVARDALKSIIKEIDSIGELNPGGELDPGNDGRVKDLLRNARVDILIVGRLRAENPGFVLSYEAVSVEDGTLFAATGPRHVDGSSQYAATPPPPMDPPVESAPLPGPDPRPRAKVRDAQRLLAALGYGPGAADGVLRMRTRAALRAFQRDQGLADHGRLTRRVMRRLRQSWRRAEIAL